MKSHTHTSHEICNEVCSAAFTELERVFRDRRRCLRMVLEESSTRVSLCSSLVCFRSNHLL